MRQKNSHRHTQQGSAFIWALAVLVVMSMLTLTASRSSSLSVRIAHNGVLQKVAYQGAESALSKTITRSKMIITSNTGTVNADGFKEKSFTTQTLNNLIIDGSVEALGISDCPDFASIAMSSELSMDSGGVTCAAYRVTGTARVDGTAVRDTHISGVKILVPADSVVDL